MMKEILSLITTFMVWNSADGQTAQPRAFNFSHVGFLDGNDCVAENVISDLNVTSKIKCCMLCSEQPGCSGVFIDEGTRRCVLCRSRVFMPSDTSSFVFYKRSGSPPESIYMVVTEALTWYSAKTNCETLGGHLLILSSAEENDVIVQFALALGLPDMFVGAKGTAGLAETFQWVDGTSVSAGFTNWKLGQPYSPNSVELYILLWKDFNYEWNDGGHMNLYHYSICEFE